ncbi:hypothetical protein LJC02_03775 [Breznakia sp. OttesenSCG-928-G09]|nr:hypothetical protein [Breznakia sp. OttesenSCG-928-G09]
MITLHIIRGDKLCDVDFDKIKQKGYDVTIMIIVVNTKDFSEVLTNTSPNNLSEYIIRILK